MVSGEIAGFFLGLAALPGSSAAELAWQGPEPVSLTLDAGGFRMQNQSIGAIVTTNGGKLERLVVHDRLQSADIPVASPFRIIFKDGTIYDSHNLNLVGEPRQHDLSPNPNASRLADRLHGKAVDASS